MLWLKRNMVLVVGGLVALGLLGLASYFLYNKIQHNQRVTEELNQTTEELRRLVNRDPHPGSDDVDNISAAQEEAKRLEAFLGEVKQFFPSTFTTTNQPSSREFRALLDNTIHELTRSAEFSGVEVPKDYWFTFGPQRTAVTFDTNVLGRLTAQLMEVKALCEVVFEAKPISLVGLKRVSVAGEDVGPQDFLTINAVTNEYAIITPYEITFHGFSDQAAAVFEGLVQSTNCFIVRNVVVYPADSAPATDPSYSTPFSPYGMSPYGYPSGRSGEGGGYGASPYGMQGSPYGGGQGFGSRYGMRGMDPSLASRYGLAPPPQPMYAPAARPSSSSAVIEEKVLRLTFEVDSVKLKASR